MLPLDIIALLYEHLQYRCDALAFRLVCRKWNEKALKHEPQRRANFAGSCCAESVSDECSGFGEFQCERCLAASLCSSDASIVCARCARMLCPNCCIFAVAFCLDCGSGCEVGCADHDEQPYCSPYSRRHEVLSPRHGEVFSPLFTRMEFCADCQILKCTSCTSDCHWRHHEVHRVSKWRSRIINLKR